jgi:hypothetical protein
MVLHVTKPLALNQCKTEDDVEKLKQEVVEINEEL